MAEFNPEVSKTPESDNQEKTSGKINCIKCVFYEVTWDKDNPRGCSMFGFKGKKMPSAVIWETTGKKCPAFKLKHKN